MTTENNHSAGIVTILFLLISLYSHAQSSDSILVAEMRREGITFSQGNSVRLLMSGRDKFADMFETIRQAKSSIHLEYFNFRNDHLQKLHADSINIYEFDPIRFPWVNHIWPRDHRKIVVIDGEVAYTGGMNVADYYIVGTEQVGEWRDMHCRIEGPAVNELQQIFLSIFRGSLPATKW